MAVFTFPPLRSPTSKPLITPFKQPFAIHPSCVLCPLPIRDNKWYDFSGHGNHGVIHNATWTAKGRHGPALYFDGLDDYVVITDHASQRGMSELTLTLWLNPTAWDTYIGVISKWSTETKRHYILWKSIGGFMFQVCDGVNLDSIETTPPSTGVWTHVVTTYKVASHLKIYFNGVEVATRTPKEALGNISNEAGEPLHIGRHHPYYFKGLIDELLMFRRSPSASEIKALYEQGLALRAG